MRFFDGVGSLRRRRTACAHGLHDCDIVMMMATQLG